jgi:alkyldihydroxyacetonephosphate synthase
MDLGELRDRLGPHAVSTDPAVLAERARDWWALAMLRESRGDHLPRPAAVLFPDSTDEVAAVLAWADEAGAAIVPRGGGSGVSGGAQPDAGHIVLDLSRMDRVLDVDQESRVVRVQAGTIGTRLEEQLEPFDLTLGHYPQSIALSSVGGWIAVASAGQASAGFGAIEDLLLGVTAVLPGGRVMTLAPVPRSAAGPDLRHLLIGSEGTLAVVTEAVVACSARPRAWTWEGFGFGSFAELSACLRDIRRSGAGAAVLRGYDEADALLNFGRLGHTGGCAAIIGFDASLPGIGERAQAIRSVAAVFGGHALGPAYGEHWWTHRNDAVDQYRRIMGPDRAFGPGAIVDTMEVAGLWSGLQALYDEVLHALSAQAEAVGCHLSHVYSSGSSLYFTFVIRGTDDVDVEPRYLQAWDGAIRACLRAGGTITHHHGVGRLKAKYLAGELGDEAVAVLRSIKRALDPHGILNPGALFP